MKTLQNINDDIAQLRGKFLNEDNQYIVDKNSKEAKQARKQLALINPARLYMETNPSEEFVRKQLADVRRELKLIREGFKVWHRNLPELRQNDPKVKLLAEYNKTMDLKSVNLQIKTLEYILS